MEFWNTEAVELISQTMLKHGVSGEPITCAKLLSLMGLEKENEDEVRLLVRKKLNHLIETKLGPGGGYLLKDVVVTKKAENTLLAQDIKDKIHAALKKGNKITVLDLQSELGYLKQRNVIADLLKDMPEFALVKGKGIIYAKSQPKITPERAAQLESKDAFRD